MNGAELRRRSASRWTEEARTMKRLGPSPMASVPEDKGKGWHGSLQSVSDKEER